MISFGSGSFIVNPNSRRSDPNFSFHIWNMRLYGLQTSVMNSHISNSEPLKIIKYAWLHLRAASFLARGPQIPLPPRSSEPHSSSPLFPLPCIPPDCQCLSGKSSPQDCSGKSASSLFYCCSCASMPSSGGQPRGAICQPP